MAVTSALVLFAVIWWMVFFVVLPLRMVTQGEAGSVVPGTSSSAPADPQMRRKVKITTLCALPVWGIVVAVIVSGAISVRDLDWFERMRPDVSSDLGDEISE